MLPPLPLPAAPRDLAPADVPAVGLPLERDQLARVGALLRGVRHGVAQPCHREHAPAVHPQRAVGGGAAVGARVEHERPRLHVARHDDGRAQLRLVGIAGRREHGGHRRARRREGALRGVPAPGRDPGQVARHAGQQREQGLRLRVAEAAVELEHVRRPIGREHQPGVEHAGVARAARRQLPERRLEHLPAYPFEQRVAGDAHGAIGAHPEGDTGPNTGGMGAYCPVSIAGDALLERVRREVLEPTLRELAARGARYTGVLYAGLMLAADGTPYVLEFNCRFGDPETQALLPLLPGVTRHLAGIAAGSWHPTERALAPARAAVATVLAAPGYPDKPELGAAIVVPRDVEAGTLVFHAGTYRDPPPDGTLRVHGGRVLTVTGLGDTVADAAQKSADACELIAFQGKTYRRDIGWREIARSSREGEGGKHAGAARG